MSTINSTTGYLPTITGKTKFEFIEGYLREMRIFVNTHCNHDCGFPNGRRWCHSKDEIPSNGGSIGLENWVKLMDGMERWNFSKLKICGMEPSLHPDIINLIRTTRNYRIKDISMTSNGSRLKGILPNLIEVGLDRLTISLHSVNPEIFKSITKGTLHPVLDTLELAKDFGIPTKLNCVLQKGVNDDIADLLDYAHVNGFDLKLYQLLWQPHYESDYQTYHVAPSDILGDVLKDSNCTQVTEFVDSQRTRFNFVTAEGVPIAFDEFQPKNDSPYQLCRTCSFRLQCEEGFIGYGLEVGPDLMLNPCYLRSNLAENLTSHLQTDFGCFQKYLDSLSISGRVVN